MKDTSTRAELNQAESHIEINKIVVILFIVSLQVLYVIYTEGKNMGLDVVASMGLVATIGIALALASKLFAPPKPLPKSKPLIIEPNDNNVALNTEGAASIMIHENETPVSQITDSSINEPQHTEAIAEAHSPKEENEADIMPPIVLLKTATATPAQTESAPIEINKWLVIAIIIALQLSYIWYTTDLKGKPTEISATAPVESTEPVEEVIPEADPLVAEAAPTEELMPTEAMPDTSSSAANIELLSEASSVKTPEIAPAKVKKAKTADSENADSVLLSGSPVNEAKTKKEKPVAAVKEPVAQGQTAIPLTNEQAKAADKTPTTNTTSAEDTLVAANNNVATANAANANAAKKEAEKPTPKSLTRGLAEAQNTMGWHYYHGDGVAKNYEESFKWFQKAANLGESSAQFNVGMMYASGTGVKQDLTEAAKWYKKSAEQGKASAQLNLGMMYISGRGIRQNIDEGKKWLTKAAEQGDVTAKANLAWLSQQGYIKSDAPSNEADKAE